MACSSCNKNKVAQNIKVQSSVKPIIRNVKPSSVRVVRN